MNVEKFIKENWYDHKPSKDWYDLIELYAKKYKNGKALDIGTSSGFSACAMAKHMYVISVDIRIQPIAEKVAEHLNLDENIMFLQETSNQFFIENYTIEKFDLIVIDGCHDYGQVLADLEYLWKALKDGGTIICDDYENYNGVNRAINDYGKEFKVEQGKAIFRK